LDNNAKALIDKVNRSDIWREAAKEAGIPAADIPESDFSGSRNSLTAKLFDPAQSASSFETA
jgi:bicarbonate transport system substrate-binding protein